MTDIALFWFRRDLRLEDNAGLYHALKAHCNVQPIFIFDTAILNKLEDRDDRRVNFIYEQLQQTEKQLQKAGSTLWIFHGEPMEVFKSLCEKHPITALFANKDYEPYARKRDKAIFEFLDTRHIPFKAFKDQVVFEKGEVLKDDGTPYTVFTPYSKKWKAKVNDFYLKSYPSERLFENLHRSGIRNWLDLKDIGFTVCQKTWSNPTIQTDLIRSYHNNRDIPAANGTSKLSVHLRFGTVSIRTLARVAAELSEKWLNELIWREFYQMILWHFPQVVEQSFKPEYDRIPWRNNETEFQAWCDGLTGYPIVDAGMRELNETGFMHNRVRMITASFLTKHLLIDWRWGEAYFAQKLIDFDLASNNGGWQWAAGTGVDAAPYFRVFNPYIQTQKFDPELSYIKKWLPEIGTPNYPSPIVEHSFARERAIATYQKALKGT